MPVNMDALMQMLSGVGAGLSQQPWTQALNQMVQSGYSSKNQFGLIDVFKKILGGEITDSTIKIDDKGMGINLSPSMISKAFGGGESKMGAPGSNQVLDPSKYSLGGQTPNVQAPNMPENLPRGPGLMDIAGALRNPSSSQLGNISAADLIGLSPKDVSNALSGALNIEQLTQAKAMQPIEAMYKGALTQQALAYAKHLNEPDQLDKPFINSYLTGEPMSLREFKAMPSKDQSYALYSHSMISKGKIPAPQHEFDMMDPTEQEKLLRSIMADPELEKMWLKGKAAGATNINIEGAVDKKIALGQAEGQIFFDSGKWIKDVQDYSGSKQARVDKFMSGKPKPQLVYERIVESIYGRGGELVEDPRWSEDGKFLVFKVKWPSGDIKEYKHAVVE